MPDTSQIIAFSILSLGMALTPGPNMLYLVSRSISQGRVAGLISLTGVALGFVLYMLCAAFGITTLMLVVPYAYEALCFGGMIYLLYLAWQAVKPGGHSPFQVKSLPKDSPKKLFTMGFITNLLNPKIAIMYLSLLPQFITPDHGSVLTQSLVLGSIQIVTSVTINALIAIMAGSIAGFLTERPAWMLVQRWLMGTVLAGLAIRIAFEARR
ncbi:LysE family translocator [Jinshanibacter sp. LJY008]|uniref:LysE family translocator n=1 Tax=Limnobaculum eriocheiris TaxID=2897391 RepID=A0A9X1MRY6_9GAMM|nr:LysE family translocator [Limnobaculum eriocheiris]MCD1124441.1 LysE family translocator [Limnobaculum eriocheiris]